MNSSQVVLEVVEGPNAGAVFRFDRHETFLVGRSVTAHLRLSEDPHFSRHHFRLEIRPPDCYLIDLDSLNGTLVNGRRVKETYLDEDDVIEGGKTKIRFSRQGKRDAPPRKRSARSRIPSVCPVPGYEIIA
ncbi:MAG: FHA domain-containing protein, partial [Planctomycetales bacterium]